MATKAMNSVKSGRDMIPWIILATALLFSAWVRLRLADFPLERDEGEYAYAGQLLLEGIPPYSQAYNMKLPGTYLAYAGLMAVFGRTAFGIHLGLLVVNLATILLVFGFTRDLFDRLSAATAALVFSILSISPTVLGMAAHATHFMAFFGVAGSWALWRAFGDRRGEAAVQTSEKAWLFPIAGLLLGTAFLTKQQGVFLPIFGGLAVVVYCARRPPVFSARHWAIALGYAAGAVLPLALTFLWLWRAGTFDKFWFWTVQYAREYVGQVPLGLGLKMFGESLKNVAGTYWPLWALALVGAVRLIRDRGVPGRRAYVFGWTAASFFCVCPGLLFREHYYIVLLPAVAMLAGAGCNALAGVAVYLATHGETDGAKPWYRSAAAAGVLVLAAAWPIWQLRGFHFVWTSEKACLCLYGVNPFVECRVIADYLKQHAEPDDRVAVLGSEPELFFYSGRKSATGYIYTYALMESHPFARKMQEEMIAEIEAAAPRYLVFVNVPYSWLARPTSEKHIFQWLDRYLVEHYRPVGVAERVSAEKTVYTWGDQAAAAKAGVQQRNNCHLWIFRRNP